MTDTLKTRIEKWLSVKVETDITDLSPVDDADMHELHDIVEAMIAEKYGDYIDGGFPIHVQLLNIHTHEQNIFSAQPRLGYKPSLKDINDYLRLANMNLCQAQQGVKDASHKLNCLVQEEIES